MKKLLPALFTILFLCSANCSNDEPLPLAEFDKYFLAYTSFPVGSTWQYSYQSNQVYEMMETTLNIIHESIDETSFGRNGKYRYQNIAYQVAAFDTILAFGGIVEFAKPSFQAKNSRLHLSAFNPSPSNGVVSHSIPFLLWPLDSLRYSQNDLAFILSESMVLGDSTYFDIISINKLKRHPLDPYKSITYGKDVGILMWEFWDGRILELQSYNLKQ